MREENEKREHPSYAMLGFYRVSGGNPRLYGSSVPHTEKIEMVLRHGYYTRDLHREWYFGGSEIARVEMSYSQFAEAIAAMNVGSGVPVTLLSTETDREIPPCDFEINMDLYQKEFDADIDAAQEKTTELLTRLEEMFSAKKSFTKKEREEILRTLTSIRSDIGANAKFVSRSFEEHIEKVTTEAKGEVEAFIQHKMRSMALEAMSEEQRKTLEKGDENV